MFSVGHKKGAGRSSVSCGNELQIFGCCVFLREIQQIDLVAMRTDFGIGNLQREFFSVGREIGFCIVTAEREFLNIPEIFFLGKNNG